MINGKGGQIVNPERWARIEELFNAALERSGKKRDEFLKEQCIGDDALYFDVVSLLNEDDQVHGLLDDKTPGVGLRSLTRSNFESRLIGKVLGEYTINSIIASGGMGAVYRAHRSDGSFEQDVAIKVIHHSLTSSNFVERFRQERQILARLNHPNIARLLDGGLTEDGLPFLVMEMVPGRPLNQYIRNNQFSIEEKLHLFLQICEAVNYAHSHLIVHRDLKPGNIFVSDTGQVKLLDFGIAKVFESDESGQPIITITQNDNAPYTPEYAAPEQINGEEISTSTDVYALGVILYEILTGGRPYEFKTKTMVEIQQVISDNIPPRPSTAVLRSEQINTNRIHLKQLSRKLRGDLDNICLKALKKEPPQRYPNVEQLHTDIRRHLTGLPVGASGDFLTYRVKKYLQRHRFGVSFSAAFLLIISVIILFYTAKLREQTRQAQEEANKSKAVSEFLGSLFEAASPEEARGKTVTAQDILAAGADRIENELMDVPDVQATMFNVIGDVYRRIAEYDKAEQLMLKSLEQYQKLHGPESEEVLILNANLGVLYLQTGNYEKADSLVDYAIAMFNVVDHVDPETKADILSTKAELVFERGEIARSDSFYAVSQKIYTAVFGEEHARIADMLNARASIARHQGNYELSEKMYLQALEMRRKFLGDDHPDVAHTLNHLGRLMYQMDKYGEAEVFTREGLALRVKIFGEINPETGASMSNLAHILSKEGKYSEAAEYYRRVLEIMNQIYTGPHPYKAITATNYGRALYWSGQPDEAEPFLRTGLEQLSAILPPGHTRTTGAMVALGNLLIDQEKISEALPLLKDAYAIRLQDDSGSDIEIAEAENALGFCLLKMGDSEAGKAHLLNSYEILKKITNMHDPVLKIANKRFVEFYPGSPR